MTKEEINSIIMAGVQAPSADNCQPWKFLVRNNEEILVYNVPERDTSLYSWGQRTSFISLGALIENMVIKAAASGYVTSVHYLPEVSDTNVVAALKITKKESDDAASSMLAASIEKRCTNRKPYMPVLFDQKQLEILTSGNDDLPKASFQFTADQAEIKKLASAAAVNEQILFSNKQLHSFFFNHINWTSQEDQKIKRGFYLPVLELPAPARAGFSLFKHWSLLRFFNLLGIPKFVAKQNAAVYATASLMGAIIVSDQEPMSYIQCGRLLQRLWLKITQMGLSSQLITGIPFLKLQVDYDNASGLSSSAVAQINKAYQTITTSFHVSDQRVALVFRVGSGAEPSARTSRAEPEIDWW